MATINPIDRPGVEVEQQFITATQTPIRPVLRSCIVGVNYLVIGLRQDDSGDYESFSGNYDGNDDPGPYIDTFEYDYPDLENHTAPIVDLTDKKPQVYILNDSDELLYELEDGVDFDALSTKVLVNKLLEVPGSTDKLKGKLLIVYRAKIEDNVNRLIEAQTFQDIEDEAGQIHPWNPLAMGMYFAKIQTGTAVYGSALEEDTPVAHGKARDFLGPKDLYAFGVLSFIQAEINNWTTWAEALSAPRQKLERRIFMGLELIDEDKKLENQTGYTNATNDDRLYDDNEDFVIEAVDKIEDKLFITTDGITFDSYTITDVQSNYLEISGTLALNQTDIWYKVAKELSVSEQAEALGQFAKAIGSSRCCIVWPPIAEFDWDIDWDGTVERVEEPGYYFSAAAAGMVSGYIPQQGFTNVPVNGFASMDLSNEYFTTEQMNLMAGGGIYILVQDFADSPIICRHQVTTASTISIEQRELSIVKAVDFFAKIVRTGLSPKIGINNITDAFLAQVKQDLNTYISRAKQPVTDPLLNTVSPLCRNAVLLFVKQDTTAPDTVLADIDWTPAYPANRIKVRIII